jgi:pyridoxine 5-phosphate synthase
MNLESAVTDEMITFALSIKPDDVCLVPERREELTTEGGLDVLRHFAQVRRACNKLAEVGIRVSLFVNADRAQIDAAVKTSAPVIEIHTGRYSDALTAKGQQEELEKICSAVTHGVNQGLKVNAGHGLHYNNVQSIAAITDISELNIGHSIVARALFIGFEQAVQEMKKLMLEEHK